MVRLLAAGAALSLGLCGAQAGTVTFASGLGGYAAAGAPALLERTSAAESEAPDGTPFQEEQAQARQAFEAGEPSKAAAAVAKLIDMIEKDERARTGRPGPQTASALTSLAWYRLFAHDYKGALAAAERAAGASPSDPLSATNRAHALMFLGRGAEAKYLHQIYKGKPLGKSGKLWEAVILDDFKELQKRGFKHAQMADIEAQLSAPLPSTTTASASSSGPAAGPGAAVPAQHPTRSNRSIFSGWRW